jgi:excisionase family DNA binding protein
MLTIAQVAMKYPVSKSLLYSACQEGLLPHYRVAGKKGCRGKYLLKEEDVLAWLESQRHDTTQPASASAPASSGSPAEPFSELNPERLKKAWKG